MYCINCKNKTIVSNSRIKKDNSVKRWRKCLKCGNDFITFEKVFNKLNIINQDKKDNLKNKELNDNLKNTLEKIKQLENVIKILKSRERGFRN